MGYHLINKVYWKAAVLVHFHVVYGFIHDTELSGMKTLTSLLSGST